MISTGISSQPPRWICPQSGRASACQQHARKAKRRSPPATPRHATQTMRLAATNLHLDDIVCCRRVG
eukprot:2400508-Prymnesium_polylepis.1